MTILFMFLNLVSFCFIVLSAPGPFFLEYWIEHFTTVLFIPDLYSQLGYSAGEDQALQLIVLVLLDALN